MKVELATSPGHPGRPNEDFVGAVPGAVVMLDGAGIPGTEELCRHGVAWYSHTLGAALLARLAVNATTDLAEALADAIEHVAGLHRHTCDLANPSSPQATVAVVRERSGQLDHLVLADAWVALDRADGDPVVVTDPREVDTRRECSAPLAGLTAGTAEYDHAWGDVVDAFRARRNQPGGYWIAKDDPAAATEAVTGTTSLHQLRGVAVLSNGASRAVDPYAVLDWPALTELLRSRGADELLRRGRAAEDAGATDQPDDATAAYWSLGSTGRPQRSQVR